MKDDAHRYYIAVNTMRARLTVLGFNLAIITFQFDTQNILKGGVKLPGFSQSVHLSSGTMLMFSTILSLLAIVLFIISGSLSERGLCEPKCLISGDLIMYLALAQTISGYLSPYLQILDLQHADPQYQLAMIRLVLVGFGTTTWIFIAYIGPVASLIRASYHRAIVGIQFVVYLGLLSGQNWLSAKLRIVETGKASGDWNLLDLLIPPITW